MARELTDLEPAERDPAQLRRTGLILAIVMVLGGVVIAGAYLIKLRAEQSEERPPVLGRLQKIFGGRDQHNKVFSTTQLEGKISLFTPISGEERARTAESLHAMKMVADKFPDDERLRFVGVTVTPERDGPEQFQEMLQELGVEGDARWFFVQAEEKNARDYLKKELRLDTREEVIIDGEKVGRFLSLIAVVDPYLHLRQHYDFNRSREVQEDARRILKEDPAEAERLNAADFTEDVSATEAHLLRTIEILRNEELKANS